MPKARHIALLACCLLLAAPGAPDARDRVARMVTEAEAPTYRAVGRLNVAGNRHCTATLISDRLVLTAAHCLFNALTGNEARPQDIMFVAGQRGDTYAALRKVNAVAKLPGYAFRRLPFARDAETDLALLHLEKPIAPGEVRPLRVGVWDRRGTVSVAAFGRDRAYIASLREGCRPQRQTPALVVLDCPVVPGVSGAPVLRTGPDGPVVVGVVSALVKDDGFAVTIAVTPEVIDLLKSRLLGDSI
jgi:V8-like Glu-specific endopeptidase